MSSVEAAAAPLDADSADATSLNSDPFVVAACEAFRALLSGSGVQRRQRRAPVSFRVTPQVHAVALGGILAVRVTALADMQCNGDNPPFFSDSDSPVFGRLVNSGNFHGAALASAVENLSRALVHVGILSEKRPYRLLDERATGLAPQLAADPGPDSGLVTVHKAASSYGASLRMLAAPVSVMQPDSSFGQEDAATMIFPSLERLGEAVSLLSIVLVARHMSQRWRSINGKRCQVMGLRRCTAASGHGSPRSPATAHTPPISISSSKPSMSW